MSWCGVWLVGCLLFVNCIVDASVLNVLAAPRVEMHLVVPSGAGGVFLCGVVLCVLCVVKLLRAHGGCLGIRSR